MKTIKEIEADLDKEWLDQWDSGYRQALKDVLGLIDKMDEEIRKQIEREEAIDEEKEKSSYEDIEAYKKMVELDEIVFKEKDEEIKELRDKLKSQKRFENKIEILEGKIKILKFDNNRLNERLTLHNKTW